jgi:hypothetical protein
MKLDITGLRSGKLVALEPTKEKSNWGIFWKCRCDCGNLVKIVASDIKTKSRKSCGNCFIRAKDLKDMKFGRLTAIKVVGTFYCGDRAAWLCICDCGNQTIVPSGNLISNKTKSCGCLFNEEQDISNIRFNKLTAIKRSGKIGRNPKWLFLCDCGNYKEYNKSDVITERKKSCGCLKFSTRVKVGDVFGEWEVLERLPELTKSRDSLWLCECSCGTISKVGQKDLYYRKSNSCGCMRTYYRKKK